MACPFCNPVPDEVVLATDAVVVLVDVRPLVAGHLLVAPRQHIPTMLELDPSTADQVDVVLTTLLSALESGAGAASSYEHGGPVLCRPHLATTAEPHAHCHVLPFDLDLLHERRVEPQTHSAETEYLSQRLGSAGATETVSISRASATKHLVRTLAAAELDKYGEPWLPLAAAAPAHALARDRTLQIVRAGLARVEPRTRQEGSRA